MAQYTFDPTQGKIVPLEQARVVTYITNDPGGMPDEQTKKAAAAAAAAAAQGAGIPTKSGAGAKTDSQNAARLEADKAATASSLYNAISTTGDELLKKQAATSAAGAAQGAGIATTSAATNAAAYELARESGKFQAAGQFRPQGSAASYGLADAQNAARVAVAEAKVKADAAVAAAAANPGNSPDAKIDQAAAVAAQKEFTAAVQAAGTATSVTSATSVPRAATTTGAATAIPVDTTEETPVDVEFAGLTAEEQAAIGAIGENAAVPTGATGNTGATGGRTVVSTFIDPATGDTYAIYTDGTRELLFKGTIVSDAAGAASAATLAAEQAAAAAAAEKKSKGQSAYDLLFSEFERYGLGSLVADVEKYIKDGLSRDELILKLRSESTAYKIRFAANTKRLNKGLRALSEAEYIATEDQYQDVMRRYGMPESYYAKGDLGVQVGFEKFLEGDVSAVELEDRIQTAQNRVVNSNPEVAKALKEFYPGISNGDILAYVLDPANAIEQIKRKVTAAEIGGAAIQSGLKTGMTRAEELAAAGITKQQAQTGFQTIAEVAPRGGVLAEIYKQDPYTQTTAEKEVFGLAGSVDAAKQRKKLTQLETAAFSGSAGMGAIARDRAGAF